MIKKILIVTGLVLSVLLVRIFWGGDEDTWICTDGEWVKHGSPNAAPRTGECE